MEFSTAETNTVQQIGRLSTFAVFKARRDLGDEYVSLSEGCESFCDLQVATLLAANHCTCFRYVTHAEKRHIGGVILGLGASRIDFCYVCQFHLQPASILYPAHSPPSTNPSSARYTFNRASTAFSSSASSRSSARVAGTSTRSSFCPLSM